MLATCLSSREAGTAGKVWGGGGVGGKHDLGEEEVVGKRPSSRILLR